MLCSLCIGVQQILDIMHGHHFVLATFQYVIIDFEKANTQETLASRLLPLPIYLGVSRSQKNFRTIKGCSSLNFSLTACSKALEYAPEWFRENAIFVCLSPGQTLLMRDL